MSKIEVDAIDKQSGSTLTLGGSGTAVTLACGATQTGFGRTGTVDWQTGDIKTSTFTPVSGQGFFVDTNGGAITANLPAGTAGSIVSFQDYRNTFDTHGLTIIPNGSQKINGGAGQVLLQTEGEGITLVYVDSTVGWRSIQDNVFADVGSDFIAATGGTVTCSGDDRIHTFTGPGTFAVTSVSPCAANNLVSYMVVAGGAGSGGMTPNCNGGGGGGGAGGFRETKSPITPYTASPLCGHGTPGNRITVTATSFPITVGGGGDGKTSNNCVGGSGSNSQFSTIIAAGGGGGGTGNCGSPARNGVAGGSGGGGGSGPATAGAGNTPPVTPSQGNSGGTSGGSPYGAGGGGGATVAGTNSGPTAQSGPGGAGATTSITGSPVAYAGGGGGGGRTPSPGGGVTHGTGGTGGGGRGQGPDNAGAGGTVNTGGGAGGGVPSATPGPIPAAGQGFNGGSGIVVIRYKRQ
jgi:hypothetical protein